MNFPRCVLGVLLIWFLPAPVPGQEVVPSIPEASGSVASQELVPSPATEEPLPGESSRWNRLDTAHFTFISQVDEASTRQMASDLERLRSVLVKLAPEGRVHSPNPTYIYLFTGYDQLRPFYLQKNGQILEGSTFFVPHRHANFGALNADPAVHPTRFLYSQYLHQLLSQQLPQLPLWLRLGLAEYYSTFEADDDQALIGKPSREHLRNRGYFGDSSLPMSTVMSLRELPASDPKEWSLLQGKCWALVHFLLNEPERRELTGVFVRRILQGEEPSSAFEATFPFAIDEIDQRLHAYLSQGGGLPFWRVQVSTEALDGAFFWHLPPHEALFYLGDLLLHSAPERRLDAGAYFERSLLLAGFSGIDYGPAWAALGEVAELGGDHQTASHNYALAVQHAAGDSLVQYLYGKSLLVTVGNQRPEDEETRQLLARSIDALTESVEFDPDFAEAWALLGFAYGLEETPDGDAVVVLQRALELLPGRTDIALNLLLAHARQGQQEAAEAMLFRMARMGASRSDLVRGAEILLQMDYRNANRLIRKENRLEDAIALFARVQAESFDPTLRQRAADRIAKFSAAAEHNRFAELYQDAITLWRREGSDRAMLDAVLRELERLAKPGLQQKAAAALKQRVAESVR